MNTWKILVTTAPHQDRLLRYLNLLLNLYLPSPSFSYLWLFGNGRFGDSQIVDIVARERSAQQTKLREFGFHWMIL